MDEQTQNTNGTRVSRGNLYPRESAEVREPVSSFAVEEVLAGAVEEPEEKEWVEFLGWNSPAILPA